MGAATSKNSMEVHLKTQPPHGPAVPPTGIYPGTIRVPSFFRMDSALGVPGRRSLSIRMACKVKLIPLNSVL